MVQHNYHHHHLLTGHSSLTKLSLQTNISHRHRAVNLFLRTYREYWLSDENVGQEVVIEDLTVSIRYEGAMCGVCKSSIREECDVR